MTENAAAKRLRTRSPAYPAISLETAVQRAKQLYDKEKRHPAPVLTVAKHWGYSSLNGAALKTIAGIKKFGLIDEDGANEDRRVSLSRLADDVLMNPVQAKRMEAIRQAALMPAIHREMWDKYGLDLPSDQSLSWELTRDRGFTDRGAAEFIKSYRATIAYAKLEPAATPETQQLQDDDPDDYEDSVRQPERAPERPRHPAGEKAKSYPIPLIDNGVVVVEGQFPITERDWKQFMAVLEAMKPGLVSATSDDALF